MNNNDLYNPYQNNHGFNLIGGNILARIGASWFVSYSYYLHVDSNHKNWTNIKTVPLRTSYFRQSTKHHKYWLTEIKNMNDALLNKNKISLNAEQLKKMVEEILEKLPD